MHDKIPSGNRISDWPSGLTGAAATGKGVSMRAVIIGDLGWNYLYHLGDEAMSVAAAGVLKGLGADVTLVGGDPVPTTRRYGYESVRRPGFKKAMDYAEKAQRLASLTKALEGRGQVPDDALPVVQSVQSADAVIIGGGGNLNSAGEHHVFDRVALARIARTFEKPLFVSSQTVGPALLDREVDLVKEIAETAECFGSREPTTGQFMRSLVGAEKVYETMDDAILLEPAAYAKVLRTLGGPPPERFVIASFTHHSGTTKLSAAGYRERVSRMLDSIVEKFDVDVLMIPHLGKFAPAKPSSDQIFNAGVVDGTSSGRVRALPIIEADVALALTREAYFSVSTRYHPVVFGPAVGTPAFGLQLSDYSVIRMQGALGNVGLSSFALPTEYLLDEKMFIERVERSMEDSVRLRSHIAWASGVRRAEQVEWWRSIYSAMGGEAFAQTRYRHWVPEFR